MRLKIHGDVLTWKDLEDYYDAGDAAYEQYKCSEQWDIDHPAPQSEDNQGPSASTYQGESKGIL
jgi:hypothetical protein